MSNGPPKIQPSTDAAVMAQLEADYPGWKIWRTRQGDVPAGWAATRMDEAVGVDATVISDTHEELRTALANQLERIQAGEAPGEAPWAR